MKVVYIDSEPVSRSGGGIRTYIQVAMKICGKFGWETAVYSHNPSAYPGFEAHAIDRLPLRNSWLRKLFYIWFYNENVLLEHSHWLSEQFEKNRQPDTLFEFCDFNGYAYFALGSKFLSRQCIVRVHTPGFLTRTPPSGMLEKCRYGLIRHIELRCLIKASQVTAPSSAFIQEKLPWLERFEYLPNPLPDKQSLPIRNRQPGDPLKMLTIGRVEKRKGTHIVIDALHKLLKNNRPASLTLAGDWGDGDYSQKARNRIRELKQHYPESVFVAGAVSKKELLTLMAQHDCCIVPSPWENSPYAFFEPLSAGLLCIGTSTGEMGSVLKQINGLAFPPGDSDALYDLLTQIICNPGAFHKLIARQNSFISQFRDNYEKKLISYYNRVVKRAV